MSTPYNALFEKLWRAFLAHQEAPAWLRCTFEATPAASMAVTRFTIELRLLEHGRVVQGKRVKYPYRRVMVVRQEDDRSLALLNGTVQQNLLMEMIRELPPMIYEFDPRIGTEDEVERLPLFDPPAASVMLTRRGLCCLCEQQYKGERRMWAGGTLGWVHPMCWSK